MVKVYEALACVGFHCEQPRQINLLELVSPNIDTENIESPELFYLLYNRPAYSTTLHHLHQLRRYEYKDFGCLTV